jgi:biotin transport system substrate-specific component
VSAPLELLWALIGLILTIGATGLEGFITNAPWDWGSTGVQVYSLRVSFQVGAVLLTGCLGGANAATLAQIAYVTLGLLLFEVFNLQIFTQGGGLAYVHEPGFGYLIGFIPAAWVCGHWAFRTAPKLESLALSGLYGLGVIHGCGLVYLVGAFVGGWLNTADAPLWRLMLGYSLAPLPGQLIMVCVVSVVGLLFRRLLFY